jgi:proteasome beta subunit
MKSFYDLVGPLPSMGARFDLAHGTTVLGLRFDKGCLMLADRRATAANFIVYDHADKIYPLDDSTLIAISGAYARSLEICRMLKHSFAYYRRMSLHELSTEGKLMEISRALAANLPMASQGVGAFLPIVCCYDKLTQDFGLYFFDAAGARFQNGEYACAGSGSERIRGIFEFVTRTQKPWMQCTLEEVLERGLRMLDIAADLDSATGGLTKILPTARVLTSEGSRPVEVDELRLAASRVIQKELFPGE